MKRIHFIAIGGAAMHNLAIALKNKGYRVTGSDDEIFDPSLSRLKQHGLLPAEWGWHPSGIDQSIEAIILGMHAHKDNPELKRALELGIRIYSYPEFLYEQTKNKTRIVIAGSHGKTTITAMIIHVLRECGISFDFMVGSQIEGFDTMVSLNKKSEIAVFEGDEYLSSPLDPQPKFLHYKPHIALISGIAWDHINVFPTYAIYLEQFRTLAAIIEPGGSLVYYADDRELLTVVECAGDTVKKLPYTEHKHEVKDEISYIKISDKQKVKLKIFGNHNLQNISGAKAVCQLLGVREQDFYRAIATFSGTKRRLQLLKKTSDTRVYFDFAHSPSKLKATVSAVKNQFQNRKLVAVFELHTYSSLNKKFMPQYKNAFDKADRAVVFFNMKVLQQKGLEIFTIDDVKTYFNDSAIEILSDAGQLETHIKQLDLHNAVLLLMSSGNFGGINLQELLV